MIEKTAWNKLVSAAADDPKSCFDAAKTRAASNLGVAANKLQIRFLHVRTLMGLEPLEANLFILEKFTEFDAAFQQDFKNRSKII